MLVRRVLGIAAVTSLAAALVACSPSTDEGGGGGAAADGSGFPVQIEHAFGTTTIETKPERVATVAWANHEVPLALGVVPVGMSKATWGDDDGDGVLPWVEASLEELGADTPVLFDETDGIDFEAVAGTDPDVILAAYSGLTQEEYDMLSKIAPVVAYSEIPWGTSMDEMIEMNAEALGLAVEGEALRDELQAEIDQALAAHPTLAEATPVFSYLDPSDLSQVGFYTTHDPRVDFLADLGIATPELVASQSEGSEEFYATVSAEEADRFADADLFITYGSDPEAFLAELQADPLLSQIPAIANGNVAVLADNTPLAAAANPSPLSISWGIADYFELLDASLAG